MFLFVGTLTYGQDLISVDVKIDTDKLIELLDKKDAKILSLNKEIAIYKKYHDQAVKNLNAANNEADSLYYYKLYYDHSKHVIGPRIIKKIELMIKKDE